MTRCYNCGFSGHLSSDSSCPAIGKTCNKCKRTGHFAARCKNDLKRKLSDDSRRESGKKVRLVKPEEDDRNFIFMVRSEYLS